MNIIRVHHRSRKRILIANVLSMIVIGPIAFGIASLGQFQGPAMWIAIILFVANMGLFGWNTWIVARKTASLSLSLTFLATIALMECINTDFAKDAANCSAARTP